MLTPVVNFLQIGVRDDLLQRVQIAQEDPNSLFVRGMRELSSSARLETYARVGASPAMVDITNQPLVISPITESAKYAVENKTWANAVQFKRQDLADSQTGQFIEAAEGLNAEAAYLPHKLGVDLLINGNSSTLGLCYDGVALFSASHPTRGALLASGTTTQSNLVSATGQTVALLRADIQSARTRLMTLRNDNGAPFHRGGMPQFLIVCPVALEGVMNEALFGVVDSYISNERFKNARTEILACPELDVSSATVWYLLRVDRGHALCLQNREPITFEFLGEGTETWVRDECGLWKVRRRCVGVYGHWHSAIRVG